MKGALRTQLLISLFSLAFVLFLNQVTTTKAQVGGGPTSDADPSSSGPYAGSIKQQDYQIPGYFHPSGLSGNPVEVRARVYWAGDNDWNPIVPGQMPVVVLVHGAHAVCHDGNNPQPFDPSTGLSVWPCPTAYPQDIWNYQGYDYLGLRLAEHGFLVISISSNGIVAKDNAENDLGMFARAQLIDQHLLRWLSWNNGQSCYPGACTRFRNKVDLTRVGLMGHSRGGEGIVRYYLYNAGNGSPFGVKALLPLAPLDINRFRPYNVALDVLLPYCDGDVVALDGTHYYDDINATSLSPSHVHLMLRANHNYFNTVWSPNSGIPGGEDDWSKDANRANDQHCRTSARLQEEPQRLSGLAYMTAFFHSYLNDDPNSKLRFYRHLTSDASPPSYVQQSGATTYVTYSAPMGQQYKRRDINPFGSTTSLSQNLLGGSVTPNALTRYELCGFNSQTGYWCLNPYLPWPPPAFQFYDPRQPHLSTYYTAHGLAGALHLKWTNPDASLNNAIPDGYRDFTRYEAIQFRAGVNFQDSSNQGQNRDLRVLLRDSSNREAIARVSWVYQSPRPNPLFFPPGTYPQSGPPNLGLPPIYPVPHMVMSTIRLSLSKFQDTTLDLAAITDVKMQFDAALSGDLVIADLSLTSSECIAVTPTPYAGRFQDVSTGHTFYTYIYRLSTRGIIAGYSCGQDASEPCVCPTRYSYFRPVNQLSRGQLAKIAVLAAGWNEPVSGQYFEDIPSGSTFYGYIQRLRSRGYINGYLCGEPGEPCVPPGNRPYYRPIRSITRAQLAKIVSNAAGYFEPIPHTQQTFADVRYCEPNPNCPGDSEFWQYVERMASRSILTGYPCGGQNEQCDPQNRHYFRPWVATTRGQASKYVQLALPGGFENEEPKWEAEPDIPGAMPTGQIPVPPAVPTP